MFTILYGVRGGRPGAIQDQCAALSMPIAASRPAAPLLCARAHRRALGAPVTLARFRLTSLPSVSDIGTLQSTSDRSRSANRRNTVLRRGYSHGYAIRYDLYSLRRSLVVRVARHRC